MASTKKAVVSKRFIRHGGRDFHERAHPDAYNLAIHAMDHCPGRAVLDLAAGSGLTSARLAEAGFDVLAMDIFPDQFVPREIQYIKADLNQRIPGADGTYWGVLALEIIEHLENPQAFLREVSRLLRPGGILVLSTPNIVSLFSKLRFLFRNEFSLFFNRPTRTADPFCDEAGGHISPLLPWLLTRFLAEAGLVDGVDPNHWTTTPYP